MSNFWQINMFDIKAHVTEVDNNSSVALKLPWSSTSMFFRLILQSKVMLLSSQNFVISYYVTYNQIMGGIGYTIWTWSVIDRVATVHDISSSCR